MIQNLGLWKPNFLLKKKDFESLINPSILEVREWFNFLRENTKNKILRIEIRGPRFHINLKHICEGDISRINIANWHQDDLLGINKKIAIWSNIYPTLIRNLDKQQIILKSKYVYIFNNQLYQHRIPSKAVGANRYYAHAIIYPINRKFKNE